MRSDTTVASQEATRIQRATSRCWRHTHRPPATHAIVENAKALRLLHHKKNQDQPWLHQETWQHLTGVEFQQQLRCAVRALLGSWKKFCKLLQQLAFALGTNKALGGLAVFEHNQSRNTHHAETHRDVTVLINIEFRNRKFASLFGCNLGENWCNCLARPTPLRPKVNQNWCVRKW